MKKIFCEILLIIAFALAVTIAWAVPPDPSVNGAGFVKAPAIFPDGEVMTFRYAVMNNGPLTSSNEIKVTVQLSKLDFNDGTFDAATDIEQDGTTPFTWSWNAVTSTLTGTLNGDFPQYTGSLFRIRNLIATEASPYPAATIGGIVRVVAPDSLNWSTGNDDSKAYTFSEPRMPVDLTSFRGHAGDGCTADLTWGIANALNFSRFEVEYAVDARNFHTLDTVAYTEGKTQYSYSQPQGERQGYYRLRMVDLDGTFRYSTIVSVVANCKGETGDETFVYPNPVTDGNFVLRYQSAFSGAATIQLTDVQGKVLISKQVRVLPGRNELTVSTAGLAAGIYYVRLLDGTIANALQVRVR